MQGKLVEELNIIYEQLIENGVMFYYGSQDIPYGEITNLEFKENNVVYIEIDDTENYEIPIDDFSENYRKSGVNYHSWSLARSFEALLD